MAASQNLPELVAATRADTKIFEKTIAATRSLQQGQITSDVPAEETRDAIVALEAAAVDIYSLFEARMQHHFKRGPFSRKLEALLLDAGQTDLAHRISQYYLAVNVLKHGTGASYRALLGDPNSFITLKPAKEFQAGQDEPPTGLIDVSVEGFFDGITTTILEAYHFLEDR